MKENQIDRLEEPQQEEEKMNKSTEKTKEEILAERQAKKVAKQGKKLEPNAAGTAVPTKLPSPATTSNEVKSSPQKAKPSVTSVASKPNPKPVEKSSTKTLPSTEKLPQVPAKENEKTKEQVHQEREARRLAKLSTKKKVDNPSAAQSAPKETKQAVAKTNSDAELAVKMEKLHIEDAATDGKPKPASKAERRAIQEAQRAAKAKALEDKKPVVKKAVEAKKSQAVPATANHLKQTAAVTNQSTKNSALHKVKLFKHLYSDKCDTNINVNQSLHPAIIKLGLQFASDAVVGSNARCYAFLNAMKTVSFFNIKSKTFCDFFFLLSSSMTT